MCVSWRFMGDFRLVHWCFKATSRLFQDCFNVIFEYVKGVPGGFLGPFCMQSKPFFDKNILKHT